MGINREVNDQYVGLVKELPFVKESKLVVAHFFEKTYYNGEFSDFSWPDKIKENEIIERVVEFLKGEMNRVLSDVVEYESYCKLSESPKRDCIQYIKENNISMVIVANRRLSGLEGVFSGSFTDHITKFSPSPIYISR